MLPNHGNKMALTVADKAPAASSVAPKSRERQAHSRVEWEGLDKRVITILEDEEKIAFVP
jgi:hypothetical protein